MKIGRLHKESGASKVLLGLAVAGALLFAACQNIFDLGEAKTESGFGYVIVDFGDSARTIRPDIGIDNVYTGGTVGSNTTPYKLQRFDYKFTGVGADGKDLTITQTWTTAPVGGPNNAPAFLLPAGTYRLEVTGYAPVLEAGSSTTYRKAVTGEYQGLVVRGGGTITISVALKPTDLTDSGSLFIGIQWPVGKLIDADNDPLTPPIPDISFDPTTQVQYVITLQQFIGDSDQLWDDSITYITNLPNFIPNNGTAKRALSNGSIPDPSDPTGVATLPVYTDTILNLAPGTYKLSGKINVNDGRFGGFSEAVHIVPNMQTRYIEDFKTATKLAEVTDYAEAQKILKEEIAAWVTNRAVLSSKPTEDLGDTIRINYIGEGLGAGIFTFPIELQLGWVLDNSGWTVPPNYNSPVVVNVKNDNVKAADWTIDNGKVVTFKVELNPVAQFSVVYGPNVNQDGNRGVTIQGVTLDKGTSGLGIGQLTDTRISVTNGAIMNNGGYAALDAGNTHTISPARSQWYKIVVYETVADQIKKGFERLEREFADSWVDVIMDNSTPRKDINRAALAKDWIPLFEDKKGADSKPGTDGVKDTVQLYYVESRLGPPTNVTVPNGTTPNAAFRRTLKFTVPDGDDDRWGYQGNFFVKNNADTSVIDIKRDETSGDIDYTESKNPDNFKQIRYTPKGGETVFFDVYMVPVAEFKVDFAPDTDYNPNLSNNPVTNNPAWVDDTDPDIVKDGGKLTINTVETEGRDSAKVKAEFTASNFVKGKNLYLGDQSITLTKVTLTTDIEDRLSNTSMRNLYKPDSPSTTLINNTAFPPGQFEDIVQEADNPYKMEGSEDNGRKAASSREYKINVYRSLANQRAAAVALLRGENSNERIRRWALTTDNDDGWGYKEAKLRNVSVNPLPTDPEEYPSTDIVYVQKVPYSYFTAGVQTTGRTSGVPTIEFPVDGTASGDTYKTLFNFDKGSGWYQGQGTLQDPGNIVNKVPNAAGNALVDVEENEYNTKPVQIKYTFKGGVADVVYQFNLIAAAEYKITFGKSPRGNPTTGSIVVTAPNPGNVGTAAPRTHRHTDSNLSNYFLVASSGSTGSVTVALDSPNPDGNIAKISKINGSDTISFTPVFSNGPGVALSLGGDPASKIASQQYEFTIYPKRETQVAEVLEALKAVENINTWGGGTPSTPGKIKSTESFDLATGDDGAVYSKFQVVGTFDTTNNNVQQIIPPGTSIGDTRPKFLTSPDYDDRLTVPYSPTVNVAQNAKGNLPVVVKFTALCDTAVNGGQPGLDGLDYTFDVTAVAKYKVNFLPGPASTSMGDGSSAKGTMQFKTYEAGNQPTYVTREVSSDLANPVFLGGIGPVDSNSTVNNLEIGSLSDHVFRVLWGADSASSLIDGSAAANNKHTATQAITSREYTINVYPSIRMQQTQVRAKLAALRANSDFFDTRPNSSGGPGWDLRTTIAPSPRSLDNISEIQFLGSDGTSVVYPRVFIPTQNGFPGKSNSTVRLLYQNPVMNNLPIIVDRTPAATADICDNEGRVVLDYFTTKLTVIATPDGDVNDANNTTYASRLADEPTGTPPNPYVNPDVSGLKRQVFRFVPYGASFNNTVDTANVYSIRLIPVAEYTVTYTPTARGEIKIVTPKANYYTYSDSGVDKEVNFTSNPIITVPNNPTVSIFPTSTSFTVTAVLGSTTISITTDPNTFKTVTIRNATNPSNGQPATGADTITPSSTSSTFTPTSRKYTIAVSND